MRRRNMAARGWLHCNHFTQRSTQLSTQGESLKSIAGFTYDSSIPEPFPTATSPDESNRLWPYTSECAGLGAASFRRLRRRLGSTWCGVVC